LRNKSAQFPPNPQAFCFPRVIFVIGITFAWSGGFGLAQREVQNKHGTISRIAGETCANRPLSAFTAM
jgi:hypothetical protein